jgi:prepilin-type N-terminal cleavage/methylation domain-containing protein
MDFPEEKGAGRVASVATSSPAGLPVESQGERRLSPFPEPPVMSKRERAAFSLVELIVVMGLISVLTALLLPTLAASRETAKMVQCQSNLRQIGQALFEYANVYKGALPCWSGWNVYPDGSSPEDAPGLAWTEELAFTFNQTPLASVYNCPAFPVDVPMKHCGTGVPPVLAVWNVGNI